MPLSPLPLLLLHAATTWFMAGLIWFVQVVHYPLAASVGPAEFRAYQAAHMARTGWVVAPPMLLELCCVALLVVAKPAALPPWSVWAGAALLAIVWGATALYSVPAHGALVEGFDAERIRVLVASNWVRTLAWSARAGLAAWMIWAVASAAGGDGSAM